ncbi:hypothetical protein ACLOJK_029697 [Asimina triloba]
MIISIEPLATSSGQSLDAPTQPHASPQPVSEAFEEEEVTSCLPLVRSSLSFRIFIFPNYDFGILIFLTATGSLIISPIMLSAAFVNVYGSFHVLDDHFLDN